MKLDARYMRTTPPNYQGIRVKQQKNSTVSHSNGISLSARQQAALETRVSEMLAGHTQENPLSYEDAIKYLRRSPPSDLQVVLVRYDVNSVLSKGLDMIEGYQVGQVEGKTSYWL